MSIAVLHQVYDEMRRLAIAGSNLANGDFRLKKLVPPLQASAAKAPVFGKVAEAIEKLINSSAKDSAPALLELSTLVSAILYTQGETGLSGKLEPIDTIDMGLPTSATSARVLKPLIEALTTTGSGREEIIRDAHQRGAFKDLRLVRVAVGAVDDPYGPIADYVCDEILPLYGKAIYDDLRSSYNPKAKGGQVRRLRLMHRLDPEKSHELVEQALESGSADMKVAAIQCLAGREEMLSYLLEQARAKNSEVRRAALGALAPFTQDEVVEALKKALLGADLKLTVRAASQNRSPKLLTFLLEEGEKQLETLFTIKEKKKLGDASDRFQNWLQCFRTRDDKQTLAFLTRCFQRRDEIGQLKPEADGQAINHLTASLLVRSDHKPALKMVADAHATLAPEVLEWAILATIRTRKPNEVYDLFSPYYLAGKAETKGKKRRSDASELKREAVRELVSTLAAPHGGRVWWGYGAYDYNDERIDLGEFAKQAKLDPRWLDAAIEQDDLEMVLALARPKHTGVQKYLLDAFEKILKKADFYYHVDDILSAMARIQHPQLVESYITALKKATSGHRQYYAYWLARLIPELPPAAAPHIEALLPNMHEKVADQITPFLAELQAQASA